MNHRPNTLIGISISLALIALVALAIGYFGHGRWAFGNYFWPMHHGYYGHGGMMGFGNMGITSMLFGALLIIAGVLTIVWLLENSRHIDSQKKSVQPDALEILQQRYARGEIDREQFIHQRDTLMESGNESFKE